MLAGSARGEWVLSAYLGAAHTQASYLRIDQPALGTHLRFDGLPYRGESFQSPLYYGYRAGYFLGRHLGLEGEFIHLKVFADVNRTARVTGTLRGAPVGGRVPVDSIVQAFSMSHGLNLLLGNVVFRQSFLERGGGLGRLLLTGRLGAGGTVPHAESDILGVADQHYQAAGPVFQAAAGVEMRLWHGLYALAEYKYTRTRPVVSISAGTAETLASSHHAVGGLAYHF